MLQFIVSNCSGCKEGFQLWRALPQVLMRDHSSQPGAALLTSRTTTSHGISDDFR